MTADASQGVVVRNKAAIGFFHAFFTQTDWSSRQVRETWYGHHAPCGRIFFIVLLSTIISTVITCPIMFSEIQMLHPMDPTELQQLRSSHHACLEALCVAAQQVTLECLVSPDGQSASIVDYGMTPDYIPIPDACLEAAEQTLGADLVNQTSTIFEERSSTETMTTTTETSFIDLVHVRNIEDENREAILKFIPSQCAAGGRSLESWFFRREDDDYDEEIISFPLVDVESLAPGQLASFQLSQWVCLEEIPFLATKSRRSFLRAFYEHLLQNRRRLLPVCFFVVQFSLYTTETMITMLSLILPSFLISYILPWPQDMVGSRRVTMWTIWKTLVLLCTITTERSSPGDLEDAALATILVVGALAYNNEKAALESGFLGLLWYLGISQLRPLFDSILEMIGTFDILNLTRLASMILDFLVPANDWWKLVTLYAIIMSYPKREQLSRRLKID